MSAQSISQIEALLSNLSPASVARLEAEAEALARAEDESRLVAELLDHGSDDEIIAWAERHYTCYRRKVPIVLARTYGRRRGYISELEREIVPHAFREHPRRPVIMRGAREVMISKYAHQGWGGSRSANGYAEALLGRYLRARRYSSFDRDEADAFVREIGHRLAAKFCLSYHFWDRIEYPVSHHQDWHLVLLGGKPTYLTDHQYTYLRTLHGIVRKTEKLDVRASLLRAARADGRFEPMKIAA